MNLPQNTFKAKLQAGALLTGLWSTSCSNIVAEIIGDSGFDWILIDTEHTPNETPSVVAQMQALATSASSVIVRPAWNDTVLIKRLLDIGVQSLLVPFVQNADEARAAVAATRYPPHGVRGVTGAGRAAKFGRIKDYLHTAADEIAVIVQIETSEALAKIADIAAVEGVDAVFIGPSDLSASMGHLGNPGHEEVQAAIKQGLATLTAMGKPAGILAFNPEVARRYIEWGANFVAVGSDLGVLLKGTTALAASYK